LKLHLLFLISRIALKELNASTLACRRIRNLYCAGEGVDVDAPCGGYNLTWAFASGYLAAAAINEILVKFNTNREVI
jgi:hypothetical protein